MVTKNATKKLSQLEQFHKVNDSVNIYRYTNGWMVEVSGEDANDDWLTVKLICADLKAVTTLLEEYKDLNLR